MRTNSSSCGHLWQMARLLLALEDFVRMQFLSLSTANVHIEHTYCDVHVIRPSCCKLGLPSPVRWTALWSLSRAVSTPVDNSPLCRLNSPHPRSCRTRPSGGMAKGASSRPWATRGQNRDRPPRTAPPPAALPLPTPSPARPAAVLPVTLAPANRAGNFLGCNSLRFRSCPWFAPAIRLLRTSQSK